MENSIITTKHGIFEITQNYRDAFNQESFEERYVDVLFDKYTYILGDLSSEKLRLKGFSSDPKNPNGFKRIPIYLAESCNQNCAYYILKRVKKIEEEIEQPLLVN
ncbi:MAG: DUF1027 domain-containing protein [Acholeplasmatales bacterium]|jgi:uncharacterized protein YutD|nr:DUF1027 domain-containing protein [Acholeplasmatales bacterium]